MLKFLPVFDVTVLCHPTAVCIVTILIVIVGQASEMPENDHGN